MIQSTAMQKMFSANTSDLQNRGSSSFKTLKFKDFSRPFKVQNVYFQASISNRHHGNKDMTMTCWK